jgi:hypothetical protein
MFTCKLQFRKRRLEMGSAGSHFAPIFFYNLQIAAEKRSGRASIAGTPAQAQRRAVGTSLALSPFARR